MQDSSSTGNYTYTQLGGGTSFQARGPHDNTAAIPSAASRVPVATRSPRHRATEAVHAAASLDRPVAPARL